MSFKSGQVVAVVGAVGAGKSSLLSAFLGKKDIGMNPAGPTTLKLNHACMCVTRH